MSYWIRTCHRWLGVALAAAVAANFVAIWLVGKPPAWITYSPLPPLFLSMFSGLYMFARSYVSGGRNEAGA